MQVHAEALQERSLAAEDRELLDGLLESNSRAGHLVAQLLALTRSDATPSQRLPAVVDFAALVQESLAILEPVAQAKRVQLGLESPSGYTLQGDAEALRMLVDNVVGNAIKYAPADSTVRVLREPGTVQLLVIDEGPDARGLRVKLRFAA